jgi:tRNA 5-methylaminomethyl-2-thiouridine biosynthesis bifunctional protein
VTAADAAAARTERVDGCWRTLDLRDAGPLNFLAAWHAWKHDPQAPRILHYVLVAAAPCSVDELIAASAEHPELLPLAHELAEQWFGFTPGAHRLSFDDGRVLLTLHVRSPGEALRSEPFTADLVLLNADIDAQAIKSIARHCRRGTRVEGAVASLDVRRALTASGFALDPGSSEQLRGVFDPAWQPRGLGASSCRELRDALVIGAGLSGAAAAASLARRGWRVTVLDAGQGPAAGASGLPVGLLAPHYSPDDNLLSRLSRAGVRMTMREARRLLREGEDWAPTGALEHRVGEPAPPTVPGGRHEPWSRVAPARKTTEALLDTTTAALWHEQAAWVKPSALIHAWLSEPRIEWRGGALVDRIEHQGEAWVALDAQGAVLGRAPDMVVAAALASAALVERGVLLNPVRGQIAWARQAAGFRAPAFAVNGNGHFIADVPYAGGRAWFSGSSYGRGDAGADIREADQRANHERLRVLLPQVAAQLDASFDAGEVQAWSGVRCTCADRRPLVGEIEPGLWIASAMGSRGLTFCALAGELIAARLHDEPLPVDHKLAQSLDVSRVLPQRTEARPQARNT